MKDFEWQFSGEKLLLKDNENLFSFLLWKIGVISFVIILPILIFFVSNYIISIISTIILFSLSFFYLRFFYNNTIFLITSRRIIKIVRTWLFSLHRKELNLLDLKQVTITTSGFIDSIFWYWNILLQWSEAESSIYMRWINDNKEVWNYVSSIISYIKLNWHTDNISRFRTKKERQNKKS